MWLAYSGIVDNLVDLKDRITLYVSNDDRDVLLSVVAFVILKLEQNTYSVCKENTLNTFCEIIR